MILLQIALLFLLYGAGQGNKLSLLVTAPDAWRPGVLESVFLQVRPQPETFPVTVSVMSYPDKKKTFSRALMSLTPENRFRGAVNLSIPAEDSPGQFVYLVVELEGFREERRIAVTTMSRSQKKESDKFTFWRRRLRSVQSVLTAQQIQDMTTRYRQYPRLQRCCRDGSDHYSEHGRCKIGGSDGLLRSKKLCHQVYEECCNHTEKHTYKAVGIISGLQDQNHHREEQENGEYHRKEAPDELLTITMSHSGGAVTRTFIVTLDPTRDVSIQVSSRMMDTDISMVVRTAPPEHP